MSLPTPSKGTYVLVTGAASGIGTELARELARRGYGLLLVDRQAERLEQIAAELNAEHHVCDLTKPRQRQALIKAATGPGLIGVCNNAGIMSFGPFHELPYAREREMVEVNAVAVHHLTGALLPALVNRGGGAILNTASLAANQPLPNAATYAATKAFVHAFSEALHEELRGTGVSVTSLQPNATATDLPVDAGVEAEARAIPDFLWASPAAVARAGVEGMLRGRRTVVPGIANQLVVVPLGRYVPRSLGLPAVRGAIRARLALSRR